MLGATGQAFLDYWTLPHFCFWVVVGSTVAALRRPRLMSLYLCIVLALAWEVFEVGAEARWPQAWNNPEGLVNKLSDLLTVPAGLWLAFTGFDKWRTPPP